MTRFLPWTSRVVCLALAAATGQAWAADGPWRPLECVPADLPAEELFDVVQPVDGFEDAKPKWAVAVGGQHAQDAWSIHPYRYPRSPEASGLVEEVTGIAAKIAAVGVQTKPWITEIGYPTHRTSGGGDEAAQARYCVRTLALLQSTHAVEKVFWYDLKDDGLAREYNEHNFGLIHHQRFHCAPKPGIVAMSVFIRLTASVTFQEIQRDGRLYCARYRRPDGSDVLLIRAEQGAQPVAMAGQVDSVCDLMGAPLADTKLTDATEHPVYITGRDLTVKRP